MEIEDRLNNQENEEILSGLFDVIYNILNKEIDESIDLDIALIKYLLLDKEIQTALEDDIPNVIKLNNIYEKCKRNILDMEVIVLYTVETYLLLFFIYSIGGWLMEVIGKLIEKRKFVNRGFLIGPYCPIYGHGAILITILLQKYIDDPIALFIMGVVVCSILEYLTSYFMEKIFHARWWDYSRYKFNINGRICLRTMIPFGLLGLFIMYVSNPFFFSIIEKIPGNILNIICIVLMLIFLVDNIISFKIISNVNITSKKIKDNTEEITGEIAEEITEKVKAILEKKSALHRRLVHAFPEMKMRIREKIKNKIN